MILECETCGANFTTANNPKRRFCSRECVYPNNVRDVKHKCKRCGVSFFPKKSDRITFCSLQCGALFRVEERSRLSKEKIEWTESEKNKVCKIEFKNCRNCDVFFTSHFHRVHCSDECRLRDRREKAKDYAKTYTPKIRRNYYQYKPKHKFYCVECKKRFKGRSKQRFCNSNCADRHHKRGYQSKRRVNIRNGFVETVHPFQVFERDRWSCKICGVKTPRKLRGTYDDRAPELDHIIPLSIGGDHSYENTQCACRKCNAMKGNMVAA